jgi:hypothetical protein
MQRTNNMSIVERSPLYEIYTPLSRKNTFMILTIHLLAIMSDTIQIAIYIPIPFDELKLILTTLCVVNYAFCLIVILFAGSEIITVENLHNNLQFFGLLTFTLTAVSLRFILSLIAVFNMSSVNLFYENMTMTYFECLLLLYIAYELIVDTKLRRQTKKTNRTIEINIPF